MNKPLAIASLKRGLLAGAFAVAGGLAWQWLASESELNMLPVLVGVAVCFAATVLFYLEGKQGL